MKRQNNIFRCGWCEGDSLYIKYHDEEWGKPVHDDRVHFEFMVLESFQCGLSWITILKKRENFRLAFSNFEPRIVSSYDETKILELMSNKGIIRNRKKIEAAINNADKFLEVAEEFGSFDSYIWNFTDNKVVRNNLKNLSDLPSKSALSDTISKDLKKRGFKFMGSVVTYSYIQSVGIINDHLIDCFRYNEI